MSTSSESGTRESTNETGGERGLTRRRLLTTGAAAGGAVALAGIDDARAGAAPPSHLSIGSTTPLTTPLTTPVGRAAATVPVPIAGRRTRLLRLTPFDFRSTVENQAITYGDYGPSTGVFFGGQPALTAQARFPLGSEVTSATVYAHVTDAVGGVTVRILEYDGIDPIGGAPTPHTLAESDDAVSQFATTTTLRRRTIPLGVTITERPLLVIVDNVRDESNNIQAIDFEYAPPAVFSPVTPGRVLDTRIAGTPGGGTLRAREVRSVFVGDSRDATGAVDLMDLIPPMASAASVNVTVTDTVGPGFVTVAPSSATSSASSTVNWWGADQTVANSSVIRMDGDQRLTLLCGPSPCSVVLDVNGYWV